MGEAEEIPTPIVLDRRRDPSHPGRRMKVSLGEAIKILYGGPLYAVPRGLPSSRVCEVCKKRYTPVQDSQKYCSRTCHDRQYRHTRKARKWGLLPPIQSIKNPGQGHGHHKEEKYG